MPSFQGGKYVLFAFSWGDRNACSPQVGHWQQTKQLIPPRSALVSHEFTGIIGAWVTQRQLNPQDFHLSLGKDQTSASLGLSAQLKQAVS